MKKTAYFVLPAAVLAFGIMFAGCPTETKKPYPQDINVTRVSPATWEKAPNGDPLKGYITIRFGAVIPGSPGSYEGNPPKVTAADLAWLEDNGAIKFTPDTDGTRTISVDPDDPVDSLVSTDVTINLERTAEPTGGTKSAKLILTPPTSFLDKYDNVYGLSDINVDF